MLKKGTVLVVEDDTDSREPLLLALGASGYDTLETLDGQEALVFALERPDIIAIITDVAMPNVSGPAFLCRLKEQKELRGGTLPPAVIVTGIGEGALEKGSAEFVAISNDNISVLKKPVGPYKVVEELEKLLAEASGKT